MYIMKIMNKLLVNIKYICVIQNNLKIKITKRPAPLIK